MSKRLPIERVTSVIWGNVVAPERDDLTGRLHDLWSEYFVGMTKADFVRTHLFEHTRLLMSFGHRGELAGFANINPHVLTLDERKYLVLTSGLFNRLKYRTSRGLQFRCVQECLKLMATHPRHSMAGIAVATSPISYDLAARMLPRFYPHPQWTPPPHVLPLLHEIARIRHLNVDATNPWITHFPVRVADAARIEQTRSYQRGSPYMSWYREQAPNWANGQVLPLWVPIDTKNALGVLWNLLRNAVQPQR